MLVYRVQPAAPAPEVNSVAAGFGLPAIVAAFGGVWVLTLLSGMPVIVSYSFLVVSTRAFDALTAQLAF